MIRIGHGFDVHAFGEDRPLIIGGVEVPYHTGFIAHSLRRGGAKRIGEVIDKFLSFAIIFKNKEVIKRNNCL